MVQHAVSAKLPIEDLLPAVEDQLKRSGLWKEEEWATERRPRVVFQDRRFAATAAFACFRTLPPGREVLFSDEFLIDPAAKEKFWKDERIPDLLRKLADALAALPEWDHDSCDHALRGLAESDGVKAGLLINAARVAFIGQAVAPPLFDSMVAIGRERVVSRLRRAVA